MINLLLSSLQKAIRKVILNNDNQKMDFFMVYATVIALERFFNE